MAMPLRRAWARRVEEEDVDEGDASSAARPDFAGVTQPVCERPDGVPKIRGPVTIDSTKA